MATTGSANVYAPQVSKSHAWPIARYATPVLASPRRLGTVYLGEMPEAYQTTLSAALTKLITEVLGEWSGPAPRLVYITDAGFHQTGYFEEVLTQMDDPHQAGRKLQWTRIVDFYHAAEYLAKLAGVLLDDPRAGHAWQKRMRHWLKHEPNAVFRILHSAAKYRSERSLTPKQQEEYRQAYQYLLNYKPYMDYASYRRMGLRESAAASRRRRVRRSSRSASSSRE